jgi:hypothetical protein
MSLNAAIPDLQGIYPLPKPHNWYFLENEISKAASVQFSYFKNYWIWYFKIGHFGRDGSLNYCYYFQILQYTTEQTALSQGEFSEEKTTIHLQSLALEYFTSQKAVMVSLITHTRKLSQTYPGQKWQSHLLSWLLCKGKILENFLLSQWI